MSNQNHKDFLNKVSMYLDGALSNEEERNLLFEIKKSPELLEKYKMEKSFREFLRSKVNRRSVSPTLIKSIKDKIRIAPN